MTSLNFSTMLTNEEKELEIALDKLKRIREQINKRRSSKGETSKTVKGDTSKAQSGLKDKGGGGDLIFYYYYFFNFSNPRSGRENCGSAKGSGGREVNLQKPTAKGRVQAETTVGGQAQEGPGGH